MKKLLLLQSQILVETNLIRMVVKITTGRMGFSAQYTTIYEKYWCKKVFH